MGRPLIGLTGFHAHWTFSSGTQKFTGVERVFTDGVLRAGGLPVVLLHDDQTVADVLDRVDGLIFTGGVDVDPSHYGAERGPETDAPDEERDAFEIALVRAAVERGIPLLGVCRGSQVVNVALGGSLVQHVPEHAVNERADQGVHDIIIEVDSTLHRLLGAQHLNVNSLHHQAVQEGAPCLRVVARAPDGIVEASEHPDLPVLAVQWHPERQNDADYWTPLLSWLVEASRATTLTRTEVH